MSIIYNALKKTESNNPGSTQQGPNESNDVSKAKTEPDKVTPKNKDLAIKIIAIVVMLSCMGGLVFFITSQGNAKLKGPSINISFNFKKLFNRPRKQKGSSGYVFNAAKYQLNGVLASDTKNIAMINGDAYAEGDPIDDLTIKSITSSEITFLAPSSEEFKIKID